MSWLTLIVKMCSFVNLALRFSRSLIACQSIFTMIHAQDLSLRRLVFPLLPGLFIPMSHRNLLIYAKNSFLIGWNFFHLTFHTRTWRINKTKLSPVFKSLKVISKPHVQYLFLTARKFFEYFLVSSHENYKYKPIQVKIFPLNVNKYSNKDASVNVTRGQVLIPGVMLLM